MRRTVLTSALGVAALGAGIALAPPASASPAPAGAVYVETNQVAGNAVLEYRRAADGSLSAPRAYPTGGTGTGTGLGSQGAVVLDRGAEHLYAVDAGSNTVTSFRVTPRGLRKVDSVPSGGTTPISVTVRGDRLYALNAGGSGSIAGFSVHRGALRPLAGSVRPLSGRCHRPGPGRVHPRRLAARGDREGHQLPRFVRAGPAWGADLARGRAVRRRHAVRLRVRPRRAPRVSEAGASTVSTYAVRPGALRAISASVATTEAAACWVVTTDDGRYVYTGNGGGSNSITGFRESPRGALALLSADGRSAGTAGGVSDIAADRGSRHLYARLGDGTVAGFRIGHDGTLTALPVAAGVPAGSAGIAARRADRTRTGGPPRGARPSACPVSGAWSRPRSPSRSGSGPRRRASPRSGFRR